MISLRIKLRADTDGKATRRSSLERRRVGPPLWLDFQWRIGFGEFRFDTPQLAAGSFIGRGFLGLARLGRDILAKESRRH